MNLPHFSKHIRQLLFPVLLLSCLGLSGCPFPPRIYRIDVQQGQYLCPELVARIKPGMHRQEVINILGTPTLCPINTERLDYYYYLKPGNGDPIQEKQVSILFRQNRVTSVQSTL